LTLSLNPEKIINTFETIGPEALFVTTACSLNQMGDENLLSSFALAGCRCKASF